MSRKQIDSIKAFLISGMLFSRLQFRLFPETMKVHDTFDESVDARARGFLIQYHLMVMLMMIKMEDENV